jgi:hypothetical protein
MDLFRAILYRYLRLLVRAVSAICLALVMAHSQLLFDVLATGLRHVPLSSRLFGKLSCVNRLFILNHRLP